MLLCNCNCNTNISLPIDIYKLILELNLILDLQFFPEYANGHTEAGKDFKNGQTGVHCNDDILLIGLFKNYTESKNYLMLV